MTDDLKRTLWGDCEALLIAGKLIGVHAIGMQARLNLGEIADVDVKLIESDLEDIASCVGRLRSDFDES